MVAVALLLTSCASTKDIAYFQNKMVNQPEMVDKHAGIVIQPKDMLSIVVSARNPELAAMFNLPVISYQAGSEIASMSSYNQRLLRLRPRRPGRRGQLHHAGMLRCRIHSGHTSRR